METEQTNGNGTAKPADKSKALVHQPEPVGEGSIDAFASAANFASAQRMAQALSASSLIPEAYRNNLPNTLIAMEQAARLRMSIFAVMQNIDVIHGRPSWRSSFLIATVNASGRFTPLRFRWEGTPGKDDFGCRAVAKDRESADECIGALITMGLAKAEGWATKNGSKWKTMPEQMLMYRAAAFWTRVYSPELSLGMRTAEEEIDVSPVDAGLVASGEVLQSLEERIKARTAPPVDAVIEEPRVEREPGSDG